MTYTQIDELPDVAPFKGSEPDMFNEWTECAVVIACMNNQEIAEIACSMVETDDFMSPGPKHVFDAISNIVEIGHGTADVVTVHEWMLGHGTLSAAGGGVYLNQLIDQLPDLTHANVTHWCEIIKRYSAERSFSGDITTLRDNRLSVEERASAVSTRLSALSISGTTHSSVEDSVAKYREEVRSGNTGVIETGFEVLDEILTIRPGNVVVVAAAPKVGKTTFALQVAAHTAKTKKVLYVTLEMSEVEIVTRYLMMLTGFSQNVIMNPSTLGGKDLKRRLDAAVERVSNLRLKICDESPLTVAGIAGMAKKIPGLALVVVDYLGLVTPSSTKESREQQISGMSRGLKSLASSSGVPVMVLSQFSRSHQHENRAPELFDLRDSGAVEQDANSVVMISGSSPKQVARVEKQLSNREISQETAAARLSHRRIYVRAQRMGPTGWVDATWDNHRARFTKVRHAN